MNRQPNLKRKREPTPIPSIRKQKDAHPSKKQRSESQAVGTEAEVPNNVIAEHSVKIHVVVMICAHLVEFVE